MTHFEIRNRFLDFFAGKKGHLVLPGSPLVSYSDPSLLFVNAGMNQFKDVFSGFKPVEDFLRERACPPLQNLVTVQKCIRAGGKHNDLEAVGESPSHHTLFEMLGNFSFGGPGSYFKERAIDLAWRFLIQELGLLPENLWVSVHKDDKESYGIWREAQKLPEHKIYRLGDKDNFWRMGQSGPCGPCTEIHYYKGREKRPRPALLNEIWNLVFMEFYENNRGARQKLPRPCVDTGMGLERLSALLQNKKSNYHTDLFRPIVQSLEKASGCLYDFGERAKTEQQKAFRVIADHSRAVAFLIGEGVLPGSQKAGYVLRRIIRRAFYYSQKLHPKKNLLLEGVRKSIKLMADLPPAHKSPEDRYDHALGSLSAPLAHKEFAKPMQHTEETKETAVAQKDRAVCHRAAKPTEGIPLARKTHSRWAPQDLGYHPELKTQANEISACVRAEAEQFSRSLAEGEKRLSAVVAGLSEKRLSADTVFLLCKSYKNLDSARIQKLCRETNWHADIKVKPHFSHKAEGQKQEQKGEQKEREQEGQKQSRKEEQEERQEEKQKRERKEGREKDQKRERKEDEEEKRGEQRLREITQSPAKKHIPPETVWRLYSAYGFPEDLTRLIARERGCSAPTEEEMKEYKTYVSQQIEKARAGNLWGDFKKSFRVGDMIAGLKPEHRKTIVTAYDKSIERGILLSGRFFAPEPNDTPTAFEEGLAYKKQPAHEEESASKRKAFPRQEGTASKAELKKAFKVSSGFGKQGAKAFLITDKSCFYPEGGGPLGDKGLLKTETGTAEVLDCQKKGDCVVHEAVITAGEIKIGQAVQQEVFPNYRHYMAGAHTATHLLHSALREVLGASVRQAGSMVQPGRLRFDFTWPRPLTQKQIQKLQERLWQSIEKGEPVAPSFKSFHQACQEGALFLKGEGYNQEEVRVISIGEGTSQELCGGIHVKNTKEIESFKIISERGTQTGVRRITAYTGFLAKAYESFLLRQNNELRSFLLSVGGLPRLPASKEEAVAPFFIRENSVWRGRAETENPFLKWMAGKERESKALRRKILRLEDDLKDDKATHESRAGFSSQKLGLGSETESRFHPLARQMEELNGVLKLPPPAPVEKQLSAFLAGSPPTGSTKTAESIESTESTKTVESIESTESTKTVESIESTEFKIATEDLFKESVSLLAHLQAKQRAFQSLSRQWSDLKKLSPSYPTQTDSSDQNLSATAPHDERGLNPIKTDSLSHRPKKTQSLREKLTAPAKDFCFKGEKGRLLVLALPVEDRKILADMSDTLLSLISPGILILAGRGEGGKHPALLCMTKHFAGALPAGRLFKDFVASVCGGSGGGKPVFAQGSVRDLSALPRAQQKLIKALREKALS